MAGFSLFLNFARAAKVLVLLLFFLPWVTVSCSPEALERLQAETRGASSEVRPSMGPPPAVVIARASGLDMATGSIQMALPPSADSPGAPGTMSGGPPELAPEIGIIVGAALLVLALVATFLLRGAAAASVGAAGSAFAALGFCYSVFFNYPPAVLAAFAAGRREGNVSADQIGQILSVKPETLFYLVLVLLVLAIVFDILAMRKSGTAATAAPPAEPPAAT